VADADRIPSRAEVRPDDCWDCSGLYAAEADWEAEFARLEERVTPLERMRGRLDSAAALARLFALETELDRTFERLHTYAHLRADEDLANQPNQARLARIRARGSELAGRLAWIMPEILAHNEAELTSWADDPILRANRFAVLKIARRKPHMLSGPEEELLARAGEILDAPHQVFSLLTNADLRFPPVMDAAGVGRELSEGRYRTFLLDPDRAIRRTAFTQFYDTYGGFRHTLAATLAHAVKAHNYLARSRRHPSARAAALHPDQVPEAVYDRLTAAVRAALPVFHRYLDLRRRRLGLAELDMYDLHVPIVPGADIKVPFAQAAEWVLAACAPLGAEYTATLRRAFAERWIDVYENRGKRSGAYSSGCYDSAPFVLLNYQGTLDDVFTLAHELGHSMHSWLANHAQPHRFARYPIFIAEIASTVNEALLLDHLLRTTDDLRIRAYLLNHLCDAFRTTVYRQTMFAEYEHLIHERDATGAPLTADGLSELYFTINSEYHGPAVKPDARIAIEWARIPHFYYDFYVYKYATSFCAARVLARQIQRDPAARDRYLELLRAGGSDDPLPLIQRAGVDLAEPAAFADALTDFNGQIDQLEKALRELS